MQRQNVRHFPDDILKWIFLNENIWILIKISLKFFFEVRINNIAALVQIMAWHRSGDKPLSEPVVVSCMLICVTRPHWVKKFVLVVQWWLNMLTHICVTRLQWSLWHIYMSMNSIWFHYVPLYKDQESLTKMTQLPHFTDAVFNNHDYFTLHENHLAFKTTLKGGLLREVPLVILHYLWNVRLLPILCCEYKCKIMQIHTWNNAILLDNNWFQWYISLFK